MASGSQAWVQTQAEIGTLFVNLDTAQLNTPTTTSQTRNDAKDTQPTSEYFLLLTSGRSIHADSTFSSSIPIHASADSASLKFDQRVPLPICQYSSSTTLQQKPKVFFRLMKRERLSGREQEIARGVSRRLPRASQTNKRINDIVNLTNRHGVGHKGTLVITMIYTNKPSTSLVSNRTNDTDLVKKMQRTAGILRFYALECIGLSHLSEQQLSLRISYNTQQHTQSGQVSMGLVEDNGVVYWGECIELEHLTADSKELRATSDVYLALVDDGGITKYTTEFKIAQLSSDQFTNGYLTWTVGDQHDGEDVELRFAFEFVNCRESPLSGLMGTLQLCIKGVNLAGKLTNNRITSASSDQENEVTGSNDRRHGHDSVLSPQGELTIVVYAHQPLRRGTGTNTTAPSRLCKTHALAISSSTQSNVSQESGSGEIDWNEYVDVPGVRQIVSIDSNGGVILGMSLWRLDAGSQSLLGDTVLNQHDVADAVAEGGLLHVKLSSGVEVVCTAKVIESPSNEVNQSRKNEVIRICHLRLRQLLIAVQKGHIVLRVTRVQSRDVVWESPQVKVNSAQKAIKLDEGLPHLPTPFDILRRDGSINFELWNNGKKMASSMLTVDMLNTTITNLPGSDVQHITVPMQSQQQTFCGELIITVTSSFSNTNTESTKSLKVQNGVKLMEPVDIVENDSRAQQGVLKLRFRQVFVIGGAGLKTVHVQADIPMYGFRGKTSSVPIQQPKGIGRWDTQTETSTLISSKASNGRGGRLKIPVTWSASESRIPELILTVLSDDASTLNQTLSLQAPLDLSALFLFPGNEIERTFSFRSKGTHGTQTPTLELQVNMGFSTQTKKSVAGHSALINCDTSIINTRRRLRANSLSYSVDGNTGKINGSLHIHVMQARHIRWQSKRDQQRNEPTSTNTRVDVRLLSDPSNTQEFHGSTQIDVGGRAAPSFDEHFIVPISDTPGSNSGSRVVTFEVCSEDGGVQQQRNIEGNQATLRAYLPVFTSLTRNGDIVDGWLPLRSNRNDDSGTIRKCGELRVSMQFVPDSVFGDSSIISTNNSVMPKSAISNTNKLALYIHMAVISQPTGWAGLFNPLVAVRELSSANMAPIHFDNLKSMSRSAPVSCQSTSEITNSCEYIWNESVSVSTNVGSANPCLEIFIVNTNTIRNNVVLGRGTIQWGELARATDRKGVWVEITDTQDRTRTLGRVQVSSMDTDNVVDVELNKLNQDEDVVGYLYANVLAGAKWDPDHEYQLVLEVGSCVYARSPWFKPWDTHNANADWTRLVLTSMGIEHDLTTARLILRSRDMDAIQIGSDVYLNGSVVGVAKVPGVIEYIDSVPNVNRAVTAGGGEWRTELKMVEIGSKGLHVKLVFQPVSHGQLSMCDVELSGGTTSQKLTAYIGAQEKLQALPVFVKATLVWPYSRCDYAVSGVKPMMGIDINGKKTAQVSRVCWKGEKWMLEVNDKTNQVSPPSLLLQAWQDDASQKENLLGECIVPLDSVLRMPGREFEMTRTLRGAVAVGTGSMGGSSHAATRNRGSATGFAISFKCSMITQNQLNIDKNDGNNTVMGPSANNDVKRLVGMRRLKDIFIRLDTDRSGKVSAAELGMALRNGQLMEELEMLFGKGTQKRFVEVVKGLNRKIEEMDYGMFLQIFQTFLDRHTTRNNGKQEEIEKNFDAISFGNRSELGYSERRGTLGSSNKSKRRTRRRSISSSISSTNTKRFSGRRTSHTDTRSKVAKQAAQRGQSAISRPFFHDGQLADSAVSTHRGDQVLPGVFTTQGPGDQALPGSHSDDNNMPAQQQQQQQQHSSSGTYQFSESSTAPNPNTNQGTGSGIMSGAETQLELYLAKELQIAQMQSDEIEAAREKADQRLGQQRAVAQQLRSSLGSTVHILMSLQKDKYLDEARRRWTQARELSELRTLEYTAEERIQRVEREQKAASKLQAVRRGTQARVAHRFKIAARISAVVKIQSVIRAKREAFLVSQYRGEVKASVVAIQKNYRGAHIRAVTHKNRRAATTIQDGYRHVKRRRMSEEAKRLSKGATKIQSQARRLSAIKRANVVRQRRARDERAASLIQFAFRDMQRRDKEFEHRAAFAAASETESKSMVGEGGGESVVVDDNAAAHAAVVLQKRARGLVSRGTTATKREKVQAAASATQRIVRGQQQREKYTRLVTLAARVPKFQGIDLTTRRRCEGILDGSVDVVSDGKKKQKMVTSVDELRESVIESACELADVASELRPVSYTLALPSDPSALSYQLRRRLDKLRSRLLASREQE